MSMFSPSAWLNRARVLSTDSPADYSKDGSLRGLNYISQSSTVLQSQAPIYPQPQHQHQHHPQSPQSQAQTNNNNRDYFDPNGRDLFDDDNEALADDEGSTSSRHHHMYRSITHHPGKGHSRGYSLPASSISGGTLSVEHDHYGAFKADLSRELNASAGIRRPTNARSRSVGGPSSLQRVPSFGNGSCISSLSADDTNYDPDEVKNPKSFDVSVVGNGNGNGPRNVPLIPKPNTHRRSISKGTDFGTAFDHLDHLINAQDLMDDDHHSHKSQHSQQQQHHHHQPVPGHHQQNNQGYHRPTSSHGRLMSERPKPLHVRAQSEALFRPRTLLSTGVDAHATLRECIVKSKAGKDEMNNATHNFNHNRLLSASNKPQILQARSTSNTVLSSTGDSASGHGGIVWNGQHIDNLIGPGPSPTRVGMQHQRSRTVGSFYSLGSAGDNLTELRTHRSMGSGASYLTQSEYSSAGAPQYLSAGALRPVSAGSIHRPGIHTRHSSDADSHYMQGDISSKEQSTANTDDMLTVDSKGSTCTSRSGRRKKNTIKDELKFVFKNLVPSPLRKISERRNKVELERSGGCLT
jgi:hypothetical protein